MRTIKFRARRKNGKWVVGNFINHFSTYFKTEERNSIFLPKPENDNGGYWVEDIDPETVGQFTGLYDCDGKEIFEGDILLVNSTNKIFTGVVTWDKNEAYYKLFYFDNNIIKQTPLFRWLYTDIILEVVGNVHDNKELMKGVER